MRRFLAACAAALLFASGAQAGVYSDDLGKCLVNHTSPADQKDLILWVFAAMSSHPDVKPYSNIGAAQRTAIDTKAATLFERLITTDCHGEAVAALKYEGASSLETSFSTLGQVAMRGLLSHPDVTTAMGALDSHIDQSKWNALSAEAGLKPAGTAH